jgi:hypothetical protein
VHVASDYIHPYKDAGGRPSHCRVRIYLPEDVLNAPVVVCSELPNNPGGSITNSAETIAAGVILASELITLWYGSSTDPRRAQTVGGDFRTGRLLQLRGRREGALPREDEGMDRRRYMEVPRSHRCRGLSGRQGVEG